MPCSSDGVEPGDRDRRLAHSLLAIRGGLSCSRIACGPSTRCGGLEAGPGIVPLVSDVRFLAKIKVGIEPHGLCVYPQPGRTSLGHTGVFR